MNDRPGLGIRALRGRRRGARGIAAVAALATGVLIATSGATASVAAPSAEFPSWSDVQAAQKSESRAKAKLKSLRAAISSAQVKADRTQKAADQRGAEYADAQQAYDEQVLVTATVQSQREAAQAAADEARLESTQFISSLARQGGNSDITAGIFGDTGGADGYLYRIGAMQKVTERSDAVYEQAVQLQNSAKQLAAQEEIEQGKLDELKESAESAFEVAQTASIAAADELAALEEAKAKATALSEFLTKKRKSTQADYLKGLREKWGTGAAGEVSPSGWARPASGYISSNFGQRYHPIYHRWMLHTGVDLAGQGCGAPIYAAHAGTVTYAGWLGDWGNYIKIDHGDGTDSGYAHIKPGGIGVRIGQEVGPGQLIARVGTTGGSTGCHLHFIIRINDNLTNPVPFMRKQGITLG